jgi:alpha-L-fucosidase
MEKIKAYLKKIDEVIEKGKYKDDWASLAKYPVPQWFKEAKLGAFIHWGVYSVPEFGSEWYSRHMYLQGHADYNHHISTYGKHTEFGYKDFIPMFTAPNFDAAKWMKDLKDAGMRYVTPVAEHHDGFKIYNSQLSKWNSVEMGPKRDILGELCEQGRKIGLRVGASHHRAEHFWFMNGMRHMGIAPDSDPDMIDFYGACALSPKGKHDRDHIMPTQEWCEDWLATACEIVDLYRPLTYYFDWWIKQPPFRPYLKKFAAYYYNRSLEWGEEVALFYKHNSYMMRSAIFDIERGAKAEISQDPYQTCTAIAKNSWSYTKGNKFKSPYTIVTTFIDIISKNGCLMLNVGPRATGEFCQEELDVLHALGQFTSLNAEAIYGTEPFFVCGEGKAKPSKGSFSERDINYTCKDFRFTYKAGALYAFAMKPNNKNGTYFINCIGTKHGKAGQFQLLIKDVSVLGYNYKVDHEIGDNGLKLKVNGVFASDMPVCFKLSID